MSRSHRRLLTGSAIVAVVAAACSHTPSAEPPTPGAAEVRPPCPSAFFVLSDEPRPVRVEVENRTDLDVRILLDRCRWWTRLGAVEAGRTAYLRLPARLLRFGDGLRFHAFAEDANRWYGTYESDFGVPVARLVVSPEAALSNRRTTRPRLAPPPG